jgi:hypothetical protein
VKDLKGRIIKLGPGIDAAAMAAAEKGKARAERAKAKTGKGKGSGKKKKRSSGVEGNGDSDDGELERLAAELKKLKQRKVGYSNKLVYPARNLKSC